MPILRALRKGSDSIYLGLTGVHISLLFIYAKFNKLKCGKTKEPLPGSAGVGPRSCCGA